MCNLTDSISRYGIPKYASIGMILCATIWLSQATKILATENKSLDCKTDKIRNPYSCGKEVTFSNSNNATASQKVDITRKNRDLHTVSASKNLDWIPKAELSVARQNSIAAHCGGAYIEPRQQYPYSKLDPAEAAIE